MSRTIKTYSLHEPTAEKFKENTPKGKTSQELEKLMQDYLDQNGVESEETVRKQKIYSGNLLTQPQKKFVETVLEQDLFGKDFPTVKKALEQEGIYTRKNHFKNALKKLSNLPDVPLQKHKGKVEADQVECEYCGANVSVKIILDNGMECRGCDATFEL